MILYLNKSGDFILWEVQMKIKILFDNKKGMTLIERNIDFITDLIKRYPNALWRRLRGKNGDGYEVDV